MHAPIKISIVLPSYNPKGNWFSDFIANIHDLENKAPDGIQFQYIVVNDGSAGTGMDDAFKSLQKKIDLIYISYAENKGKGFAMRTGVARATAQFTILTDFDFPYASENIIKMIDYLLAGYEIVIGKRTSEYFKSLPVKRRIISKAYMMLSRFSFQLPLYDIQSGIKGFGWRGKEVFLETGINRFLVDTEFVLRAIKKGLLVKVLDVSIKSNLQFTNFGRTVIITELKNLATLFRLNRQLKSRCTEISNAEMAAEISLETLTTSHGKKHTVEF